MFKQKIRVGLSQNQPTNARISHTKANGNDMSASSPGHTWNATLFVPHHKTWFVSYTILRFILRTTYHVNQTAVALFDPTRERVQIAFTEIYSFMGLQYHTVLLHNEASTVIPRPTYQNTSAHVFRKLMLNEMVSSNTDWAPLPAPTLLHLPLRSMAIDQISEIVESRGFRAVFCDLLQQVRSCIHVQRLDERSAWAVCRRQYMLSTANSKFTCSGAKYSGVPQRVKAFVNPSLAMRYSISTA